MLMVKSASITGLLVPLPRVIELAGAVDTDGSSLPSYHVTGVGVAVLELFGALGHGGVPYLCSVSVVGGDFDLYGVVEGAAHRSHFWCLQRRAGHNAYLEGGRARPVFVVAGKRGGHSHRGGGLDECSAYLTTLIHLADGLVR